MLKSFVLAATSIAYFVSIANIADARNQGIDCNTALAEARNSSEFRNFNKPLTCKPSKADLDDIYKVVAEGFKFINERGDSLSIIERQSADKRGEDLNSLDRQLYFLEAKNIKLTQFNIGNSGLKEAEFEILQVQRLYNIEEMGSANSPRKFKFKSQSIKKVNVRLYQSVDKKWSINGGIHYLPS